jgi:hypothetical protein
MLGLVLHLDHIDIKALGFDTHTILFVNTKRTFSIVLSIFHFHYAHFILVHSMYDLVLCINR